MASLSGNRFILNNFALANEGHNEILVKAVDEVEHISQRLIQVELDTQSIEIIEVQPGDQSKSVPVTLDIRVELSEAPLEATVNSQSFYVQANNETLAGTISIEGKTCIFKPTQPLPGDTEITSRITAAITDRAGNPLKGGDIEWRFTTRDNTPPPAPELDAIPQRTYQPDLLLEGSAEKRALILVSGGAAPVQCITNETGRFQVRVPLKPDQLNQLRVEARDKANNLSHPVLASLYQNSGEFIVSDAQLEEQTGRITMFFTRPLEPAGLTAANIRVTTASGTIAGLLTAAAGNREAVFTPGGVLPTGTAILLEVGTGVTDAEGNALAYRYSKIFNRGMAGGSILLAGEVYSQCDNRPVSGARVQLISINGTPAAPPAPQVLTTPEGKYILVLPGNEYSEGKAVVCISKENYTRVTREVNLAPGFCGTLFDARLMELNPETGVITPAGGVIKSNSGCKTGQYTRKADSQTGGGKIEGVLIAPAGAVETEKTLRISVVGDQALAGRLPPGWSPLAVLEIAAFGDQGALFEKTAPWTPAKTFSSPSGSGSDQDSEPTARRAIKSFDQTFSKVWPPAGPPEATQQFQKPCTLRIVNYRPGINAV